MLIEINIHTIMSKNLKASQFIMLKLLFNNNYNTFVNYLLSEDLESEFKDLVDRGYVIGYEPNLPATYLSLSHTSIKDVLGYDDSYFWEFFSMYPMKVVTRRGGVRILHPAAPESKKAKELKKKYESVVKTKAKHDYVINCLEAELLLRRKGGDLEFMQLMETYINNNSWDNYAYQLDVAVKRNEDQKEEGNKYGERLI